MRGRGPRGGVRRPRATAGTASCPALGDVRPGWCRRLTCAMSVAVDDDLWSAIAGPDAVAGCSTSCSPTVPGRRRTLSERPAGRPVRPSRSIWWFWTAWAWCTSRPPDGERRYQRGRCPAGAARSPSCADVGGRRWDARAAAEQADRRGDRSAADDTQPVQTASTRRRNRHGGRSCTGSGSQSATPRRGVRGADRRRGACRAASATDANGQPRSVRTLERRCRARRASHRGAELAPRRERARRSLTGRPSGSGDGAVGTSRGGRLHEVVLFAHEGRPEPVELVHHCGTRSGVGPGEPRGGRAGARRTQPDEPRTAPLAPIAGGVAADCPTVTATILDGKATAAAIRAELTDAGRGAAPQPGIVPGLGTVLVGDDPGSRWLRRRQAPRLRRGRHRQHRSASCRPPPRRPTSRRSSTSSTPTRPAPATSSSCRCRAGLDASAVLERMDPAKDADGLHPVNLGRLVLGVPGAAAVHAASASSSCCAATTSRSPAPRSSSSAAASPSAGRWGCC